MSIAPLDLAKAWADPTNNFATVQTAALWITDTVRWNLKPTGINPARDWGDSLGHQDVTGDELSSADSVAKFRAISLVSPEDMQIQLNVRYWRSV